MARARGTAPGRSVQEIMTPDPIAMPASSAVLQAARVMRDQNIGDVIVMQDNSICGIVTDRDIVVRCIAEAHDPAQTPLGDICSRDLTTLSLQDTEDDALRLMQDKALRRLPVVQDGKPVGIVSIGDLALEREPASVLGRISEAPPNR